jgi:chromosome segregation ATPase
VKQAVAEAVRAEKGQMSPASFSGAPADLKQLEDVIMKEREERKTLKAQLKQEKKQCETLQDKIKSLEKARSDVDLEMKRMERENINRGKEIEILQAELSDLRNEKILSEQLDEEHSAKMKVYTKDLMATSQKYQQDIQNLIAKNEKLTKEVELLKAKGAELERQAEHAEQVKDALNRKLIGKDNDISSLQSQLEKVMKEKKLVESSIGQQKPAPSFNKPDVSAFANRIKELEAIVEAQKQTIQDHENRVMNTSADDAFGILRSAKAVTPARRVSHLTSRREAQSYVPAPTADWLEPLAIAEHVLTTIS